MGERARRVPAIRCLDLSFADPAENLALDEALLESAGAPDSAGCLRFWESPVPFVALGVSQAAEKEAHLAHCREDGIAVLRRCSAGGCVLQGPGSLNYALALPLDRFPELRGIHASYADILGQLCRAFAELGIELTHQGISDLALDGRKVSGNAQRRTKNTLLHHGTLLYRAEYGKMERYLREPRECPAYRCGRGHRDFVTVLPIDSDTVKRAVSQAFSPLENAGELDAALRCRAETLAKEKYRDPKWNFRR